MEVELSKSVKKLLDAKGKVPSHIEDKLLYWVSEVERIGLAEVQKIKGFHDEPLKGSKFGRRSIRLSKQWRAEYTKKEKDKIEFVLVQEVHPHDYKK